MLQATVWRVQVQFPEAHLVIVTSSPDRLAALFPGAAPVSALAREEWFGQVPLIDRGIASSPVAGASRTGHGLPPSSPDAWVQSLPPESEWTEDSCPGLEYIDTIRKADLLIISGQGTFNDTMKEATMRVLILMVMCHRWNIPAVMFSQGFGPITDPDLITWMRHSLPHVHFIALREKRLGLPLLEAAGVKETQMAVTGDDAIQYAHFFRTRQLGPGLGVNLRLADYAQVGETHLRAIRSAMERIAHKLSGPFVPIPISHDPSTYDPGAIQELLKGYSSFTDGGQSLDTLYRTLHEVSRCRVVITGSYHAGVFALAQGIPVVAIAPSAYYQGKFLGLLDQFGTGCEVLVGEDAAGHLEEAVERLWSSSETLRPALLAAAERQIEEGRAAYQRALSAISG